MKTKRVTLPCKVCLEHDLEIGEATHWPGLLRLRITPGPIGPIVLSRKDMRRLIAVASKLLSQPAQKQPELE